MLTPVLLAGCAGDESLAPSATPSVATPASTAPAVPSETPAALVPGGTAVDNLPLFREVTLRVWNSPDAASGRAYVDALTAAGFDRSAMQVTEDHSTVGDPAESIQFSVRWGDECLVGQVGPATGDPVVAALPVLAEGTCLVGRTRPIDW